MILAQNLKEPLQPRSLPPCSPCSFVRGARPDSPVVLTSFSPLPATPTHQTVSKLVTPNPENSIFCPLCFQSLAHSFLPRAKPRGARSGLFRTYILCSHTLTNSFARAHSTTPLQSVLSALFAQNTGGGYTPKIYLLFSSVYALFKVRPPRTSRGDSIRPKVASLVTSHQQSTTNH